MGELYKITFPNGKSYIGITRKTAAHRFVVHVRASRHRDNAICHAIRKYGAALAQVETLLVASPDYLAAIEPHAITAFGTKAPHGYNMTDGGEGTPNPTAETRAKIGASHKPGKPRHTQPHSAEAKAKMSERKKGKPLSAAHCENIRRALLGNDYMTGKTLTAEHRANMSAAHMGKQFTAEHRANIVKAAFAREAKKRAERGTT